MAWDSKSARRRHEPNATPKSVQKSTSPSEAITAKSPHVADPVLQSFLAPSFDSADFLNTNLPSLATNTSQITRSQDVSLTELSTHTQTLLSNLGAHTTRLTNVLTQLTDEILRSGSRLAYEVEVLRGETLGLSEALTEGLQDDVSNFVLNDVDEYLAKKTTHPTELNESQRHSSTVTGPKSPVKDEIIQQNQDPAYITQLRTLTSVRNRLETVIKTFGDAMSWTFPPSEVSVTSSFLSVSAPEPGSEAHSIEEKGQLVSKRMRDEIADLLLSRDPVDGIEDAAKRVEELKELAKVWKGTAEEKGRAKFVDSLAKMVEDRHRELVREAEHDGRISSRIGQRSDGNRINDTSSNIDAKPQSGYGFISQLQKMRSGL